MTIKELAEMMNKPKPTVRDIAKRLFPDLIKPKVKTHLTELQALKIAGELQYHAKENLQLNGGRPDSGRLSSSDVQMIADVVAASMAKYLGAMMPTQPKPLQIEHSHLTALAFSIQRGLPTDYQSVKKLGYYAAVYSRNQGLTVEKMADPRYGTINAYTVQALEAAL